AFAQPDDLKSGPDGVRVARREAGNDAVGVALVDHHEAERAPLARERFLRIVTRDPLAAPLFPKGFDVGIEARRLGRPDDVGLRQVERELESARANDARSAEQDGLADALVGDDLRGPESLVVFSLGEDDARVGRLRQAEDLAHDLARGVDAALESVA